MKKLLSWQIDRKQNTNFYDENWTNEDIIYHDQSMIIDNYYINDCTRWIFDDISKKDLDEMLYYFGVGEYETDENFLVRRDRIIRDNQQIAKNALATARKVFPDEELYR